MILGNYLRGIILFVGLVVFMSQVCDGASDGYRHFMNQCEQAKHVRNYAAMETAIQNALKQGPGDEYAWRSLAWAQGRQGKWGASLLNAKENVRRNGSSGWSLAQLADSALGNADFVLARQVLDQAMALPARSRQDSAEALRSARERLSMAMETRTYQLQFTVDLGQGGPTKKPVWLLIPQLNTPQQSFAYTVRNAISATPRHVGVRDYIEVVQRPGQPFYIDATFVVKPGCLGNARLAAVPPGDCPEALKVHLAKFLNYSWWDPNLPEVQAIVPAVKGKTSAETVQNILNWFKQNIRYDLSIKDDPALGQLGTILKLRHGGCHHMSGLFVALARAAGVPSCVAHGTVLPTGAKPFVITPATGHGWAEVYLNSIGWVPVEPTDFNSLRMFTANRTYLSVGPSNQPPESHHFASTITYENQEYRLVSIQGSQEIKGQPTTAGR
jgi:hypothetical protein